MFRTCLLVYSMTLGTRYRPFSTAGAMAWKATWRSVSVTVSSRRRWVTSCAWAIGAIPRVSTACMVAMRSKMLLSWACVACASASLVSMRARRAMRLTSSWVRDMEAPEYLRERSPLGYHRPLVFSALSPAWRGCCRHHVQVPDQLFLHRSRDRSRHRQHADLRARPRHRAGRTLGGVDPHRRGRGRQAHGAGSG